MGDYWQVENERIGIILKQPSINVATRYQLTHEIQQHIHVMYLLPLVPIACSIAHNLPLSN